MYVNRLQVLLVDDDPVIGEVLVPDVLEDSEHALTWTNTVEGALKHIAAAGAGKLACDVVILDFKLSETDTGNAHEVLAGVRRHFGEDFPVIGFSTARMADMGVGGLYMDLGKEGLFDLPDVLDGLAAQVTPSAAHVA